MRTLCALTFGLFMLVCLISCKRKESAVQGLPLDFSKHYSIESLYNSKERLLLVVVKLDPLLHAYAALEKIGKPVGLKILPTNGWSADTPPDIPKGQKKDLLGLGESMVIEGTFRVHQKVKPGIGNGEAELMLQVCTVNACDRPRTHKLIIKE